MKVRLFRVSAIIELAAGLALLVAPTIVVAQLLGSPLDTPSALIAARVAGSALVSLGFACLLARQEDGDALVAAMLAYNAAVPAILMHAYFGVGLDGAGLWPATILHSGLAIWCLSIMMAASMEH